MLEPSPDEAPVIPGWALRPARGPVGLSNAAALDHIHDLLGRHIRSGGAEGEGESLVENIETLLAQTGRRIIRLADITTDVLERTDGQPVGLIDADQVVTFVQQTSDGTFVVEVHTRDAVPGLHVLLDGVPLQPATPASATAPDATAPRAA